MQSYIGSTHIYFLNTFSHWSCCTEELKQMGEIMRKNKTKQNITKDKIVCFILHSSSAVLSLVVGGILSQEYFGVVLGPCITVKGLVYQKESFGNLLGVCIAVKG